MNENTNPDVKTIENATRDDVRPGDHITWTRVWERDGVAVKIIYEGIAHHRADDDNDWWTKGGMYITNGEGDGTTLTIRRPTQELPTKPGTVIVANDGCEYIEAVVSGVVWRTREAILSSDGRWHGVWRAGSVAVGSTSSDSITPGTWKVDEK